MKSRLDNIRFHFEQGGVIQTEDARWLIEQVAQGGEIIKGLLKMIADKNKDELFAALQEVAHEYLSGAPPL